ncbi:MAG: glycosidase related protein [Geminicoccaceae bacterium]|nr:glycosidase related protein [Geminicoccaceae bacterium]
MLPLDPALLPRTMPPDTTAIRSAKNPIVTPAMVPPSRPDLEVVGVFNPAAVRHGSEVILLLRVAEAPRDVPAHEVAAPVFDPVSGQLEIMRWLRSAPGVDTTDPRMTVVDGRTWLTSISHLRVARSRDGIHFDIEPAPALRAANEYEAFGVEDARITLIDGTYWINYTAVSSYGIATALASTTDFERFERHGVIFPPNNRDVTIFPATIGGRYVALHRPMPSGLGETAIWFATSPDLRAWGDHRLVAAARRGGWEDIKVGGGAVPFRVRHGAQDGWLAIYHGVSGSPHVYSLGALLLDADDPARAIARSREPILRPEAPYERSGFFGGVVFTCGVVADGDRVRVYYGAADGVTAVADLSLAHILAGLGDP